MCTTLQIVKVNPVRSGVAREKLGGVPPVGTYKAIISFAALTGRRAGEIGPQVIDLVPVAN